MVFDISYNFCFDSIDRNALWLLLRSLGIPSKLVDMLKDLYSELRASRRVILRLVSLQL